MKIKVGQYYIHKRNGTIVMLKELGTNVSFLSGAGLVAVTPKVNEYEGYGTPFLASIAYFKANYTKLNKLQEALLV